GGAPLSIGHRRRWIEWASYCRFPLEAREEIFLPYIIDATPGERTSYEGSKIHIPDGIPLQEEYLSIYSTFSAEQM
ncbi:unnamed protein product, partial [Urochloa humidicola]